MVKVWVVGVLEEEQTATISTIKNKKTTCWWEQYHQYQSHDKYQPIMATISSILMMVQKSQTTTWDGAKTRRK